MLSKISTVKTIYGKFVGFMPFVNITYIYFELYDCLTNVARVKVLFAIDRFYA